MNNFILSCKNISLTLNQVPIIENINFSLYPGEFHLLMGENGAGKTTLANILSGVYPFKSYSGTIIFNQQELRLTTPRDAIKKKIITIHQDTHLYENMTIADNLYANLPAKTALNKFISSKKRIQLANIFFQKHNVYIDSSRMVNECSAVTKRKVELLKLYLMEPDLLILDEPVAFMSSYEIEFFLDIIKHFKNKGVTILCISHKYQTFYNLIDRFSIFYDKELKTTFTREDIDNGNINSLLFADFCQSRYPKIQVKKGKEVLCTEHLATDGSLKDISFSLQQGEILGFFGRSGSGRNTLSKALFGIEPLTSGTIYIDRLPTRITCPQDALDLGLAYITDERIDTGLFSNLDLLENVYSIKENNLGRFWTHTALEYNRYYKYTKKLNLNLNPHMNPDSLSGGEQQKLIMMRWLMSSARIFIFNEPTQSIDVPSKIDIYNMFNDLLLKGASILVFSSNLEELMGICDRIIFIKDGTVSGEISHDESPSSIQDLI